MTQYFGVDPLSAPWWLVATQVNSLCFSSWVLNYFKPCDVSFQCLSIVIGWKLPSALCWPDLGLHSLDMAGEST